jgi:hypothetical protein
LLSLQSCLVEHFIFEINDGLVESPNAESAVPKVSWASSRISGTVTEPCFVPFATIISGGDVCLAEPTRVSSAFQKNLMEPMCNDVHKIRFEVIGRDFMTFLLEMLGPLDSKLLAVSTRKMIGSESVDKDRLFCEIVNQVTKHDQVSRLLVSKTGSYNIIF